MLYAVGLDWGGAGHTVCVPDATSAMRRQFEISHTADGLTTLHCRLAALGRPAELLVAIERPSGLLVDAVKASRPRYRSSGAKDDRSDARLLADLPRTDGHRSHAAGRRGKFTRAAVAGGGGGDRLR